MFEVKSPVRINSRGYGAAMQLPIRRHESANNVFKAAVLSEA